MGRSIFQQETQVRASLVADRTDAVAPSEANYETNAVSLLDDINNLSSAISYLKDVQAGNWYDVQTAPSALEAGVLRGVNGVNDGLHAMEKKRVLVDTFVHVDVTVSNGQNWETLLIGELPTQTIAAIGSVTTLGTVGAFHTGTFDTHSLDLVTGDSPVQPLNMGIIVDSATHDPVVSGGRNVYGLFQLEENTDGLTMTGTTTKRAQISFVRLNAGGTAMEAVPVADIEDLVIHYTCRTRKRLEDLTEQDFLKGAVVDIGAGTSTVDRQNAYNNQGVTVVDLTTNATLDLAAGLTWAIRDVGDNVIFSAHEGDSGSDGIFQVGAGADTFDVDAATNDFLNGAAFDTGAAGTTINVGVTANQIDTTGALTMTAAGIMKVASSGAALRFSDSFEPAGWSEDGIQLSDAAQTWTDFEAAFGEVGLMDAILQAYNAQGGTKVWSVCTANVAADVDISGPSDDNNFDTDFGDLSAGTFISDYEFYYNGQYLRPGANAAANHDIYPGTALADGQLKLEFKAKIGDQLAILANI